MDKGRFNIQWHITDRCNCRCLHCYQSEYSVQTEYSVLLQMLNQYAAFFNYMGQQGILTITGGEPLIHPDFWSLLEILVSQYPQIAWAVLTNGTLIDAETARRLAELGPRFVQVSIEGRAPVHDRIRGAGNYKAALEGIRNLSRCGVRVSVSFTAHAANYREITHVARLARRIKGVRVWSDRMIPAAGEQDPLALNPVQSYDYLKKMRSSGCVSMNRALQFLEGGNSYRCVAGLSLMTVMPDGTVYPCRRLPIPAGNLLQESLDAIYEGPLMLELRTRTCEDCAACLYREVCNGGLRCLAYAQTGNMWNADPGCPVKAGIYRLDARRWLR